jgi:hypothetical protein
LSLPVVLKLLISILGSLLTDLTNDFSHLFKDSSYIDFNQSSKSFIIQEAKGLFLFLSISDCKKLNHSSNIFLYSVKSLDSFNFLKVFFISFVLLSSKYSDNNLIKLLSCLFKFNSYLITSISLVSISIVDFHQFNSINFFISSSLNNL